MMPATAPENILPEDGTVLYFGKILTEKETTHYFRSLLQAVDWKPDKLFLFGKHHITKRKTGWFGDQAFEYTYSNSTKKALPWTPELRELKLLVEQKTSQHFNSCLLNLYHSGEEGMSWHSDNEKELGPNPAIAALSLGAERRFSFKHRETRQTVWLPLENGSLLLMKDATQENWLHALPKTKKVKEARISLTFRNIIEVQ